MTFVELTETMLALGCTVREAEVDLQAGSGNSIRFTNVDGNIARGVAS